MSGYDARQDEVCSSSRVNLHWSDNALQDYDYDYYQQPSGVRYRQASQYSQNSYPAYVTPQDDVAPEQQQAYYANSYSNTTADARGWPQDASTYPGEDSQWSVHRATHAPTGVTDPAAYSSLFEGTDQAVHGNPSGFQFQSAESSGGNYGSEVAGYHHGGTAGHSAQMSHRNFGGSTLGYSQETQAIYGGSSHSDRAPVLRVHAAPDSGRGGLVRSASTSGYSEGSTYALSNAGSSMLSPNYGHDADYEEEESSEESRSPDSQLPASPSGAETNNDPERKWTCKQAECAERRGFKRHADLLRHMSTVHHRGDREKFDCPKRTCPRKGENGFTRKDHLTEHLRNFHLQRIPKRRGGRGKGREQS
ncbi:hypothetical protein BK809_0001041 [Diplodia seriata]|uniref:C2H2-type domain-containing protein n=1 Tax=Diplodia seriata TaxID=420778 RepID=A0A1S8B6M9_9PEZI|nr:hypothetical protein BK809_0001041 [Diplodia seriata]